VNFAIRRFTRSALGRSETSSYILSRTDRNRTVLDQPPPTSEDEMVYYYSSDNVPTEPPHRVVSTVPSMTETLFELGFGDRVVGITQDCLFPAEQVESKFKVGTIDALNIQDIVALNPDVVIVNREENTATDIVALEDAGLHVWKTFPRTVREAMNLIWDTLHMFMVDDRMLYERVNLIHRTIDWVGGVSEAHEDDICKVFVPLLPQPLTTFGADTYTHDLLKTAGGTNVFEHLGEPSTGDPAEDISRYPQVTLEDVQETQPDIIILPSTPLGFTETHLEKFKQHLDVPATATGEVYLIDGSLFTYHGVRLARALNEISALMCLAEEKSE